MMMIAALLLSCLVFAVSIDFSFGDKHVVNYRDTCPTPDYPTHCCRGKLRHAGFQAEEHMHYTIHEQAELRTEFYLRKLLVSLSRISTPNLGCFLGFMGDSLMGDTFMAMICQLKMMGISRGRITSLSLERRHTTLEKPFNIDQGWVSERSN
jgi:hypothetical protein